MLRLGIHLPVKSYSLFAFVYVSFVYTKLSQESSAYLITMRRFGRGHTTGKKEAVVYTHHVCVRVSVP